MINTIVISLGSNQTARERLDKGCRMLKRIVPCITFSPAMLTTPIGMPPGTPDFIDIVAVGYTNLDRRTLHKRLKEMERLLGRKPKGLRHPQVIEADIDLLIFNQKCLKPQDLKRPYVAVGLSSLNKEQQYAYLFKGQ